MSFTGVGPTRCTPTATRSQRDSSDIRQENPPAGTGSYLTRAGQSPFRCRPEMRSLMHLPGMRTRNRPMRRWRTSLTVPILVLVSPPLVTGQALSHETPSPRQDDRLASSNQPPFLGWSRVGWKQQRNFRASIEEPYKDDVSRHSPVRFVQPVASQFNATSSESRKIAWRTSPYQEISPCHIQNSRHPAS